MICARELFNRHKLRCTRQRLALFEALRQSRSHPTAEELFKSVSPRIGGMSRATVYNTLERLCQSGLARRIPMTNGCCRYDADTTEHLHIRMRDSMEILDVPPELNDRLIANLPAHVLAEIEHRMGIRIDGVSIQLIASTMVRQA